MNSNDVFKQLAINSLLNSGDLQEQIKQFVFYDRVEVESRRKKNQLIKEIKYGLCYCLENFDTHWSISYDLNDEFKCWESQNCRCCGGFYIIGDEVASEVNPSIACQCDEDYATEILMRHFSFVPTQRNFYGN
jgi:hypothetical protein